MANTFFKSFAEADRTSSRTLLHEAIPITGTIVSGTYDGNNVRSFTHGMFKSVYDYPYLSSSANHLFDVTWGYVSSSEIDSQIEGQNLLTSGDDSTVSNQGSKKKNMYSQMAQILVGFDTEGKVRPFDFDGNHAGGAKIGSAIFINFSRLLVKDEIKKGSFAMTFGKADSYTNPFGTTVTLSDTAAVNDYHVNSPAGEYGILVENGTTNQRGLIFYQAGIAVIPASSDVTGDESTAQWTSSTVNGKKLGILTTGSMDQFADGLVNRIKNIEFNNTTELNSTIYFCRANHNEFNYSSNPTYLSGSKITVKADNIMTPPRSYVTTVGLYSADNELLAVAKLSEPLRKDPTSELTLRVRLDY